MTCTFVKRNSMASEEAPQHINCWLQVSLHPGNLFLGRKLGKFFVYKVVCTLYVDYIIWRWGRAGVLCNYDGGKVWWDSGKSNVISPVLSEVFKAYHWYQLGLMYAPTSLLVFQKHLFSKKQKKTPIILSILFEFMSYYRLKNSILCFFKISSF